MADKKVSELDGVTSLNATDLFLVVQGGRTKKVQAATLFGSARGLNLVGGYVRVTSKNEFSTGTFLPVDKAIVHILTVELGEEQKVLPDGVEGQELTILCDELSSPITVSPTSPAGFTGIQMGSLGSSVKLYFTNSAWYIVSAFNVGVS